MKIGEDETTVLLERNGFVASILATTRTHLDSETETRVLSQEVDELRKSRPDG